MQALTTQLPMYCRLGHLHQGDIYYDRFVCGFDVARWRHYRVLVRPNERPRDSQFPLIISPWRRKETRVYSHCQVFSLIAAYFRVMTRCAPTPVPDIT